jgi:hypothetical protein
MRVPVRANNECGLDNASAHSSIACVSHAVNIAYLEKVARSIRVA